ncbi:16S rRNA (cytidine(1402)-2'-O)-methyltransferase [Sandaracinobacter neustonicus]|uniref:Ribosomal RNA small subunit methyltransferase I n=1 Tax=Sandaracinobacter neustonicus TaxID=1715348 RepID=A0A501XRC1_9SPHN|nr:16S rRNA (cytidine(1402)-2'-O)-methyltransferase [Sandaracinobacter neustonicus]TPE62657.1 16S rRNA (cytidine(1402)-2'-O)-methyltransferase [Sandaracinobacter neustonicus]
MRAAPPTIESSAETPEDRLAPGLYIVAGPIGNLEDLSPRAARILRTADVVACEDTRVTAKLLRAAGSERPMLPYHEHSGPDVEAKLLERLGRESVALVSDAGTPLISDPGYSLVREARARGLAVSTAPGPSAAITALSISGLPSDRFLFAGFLPAKAVAREKAISAVVGIPATLIFYETGPRLAASLAALAAALGGRDAAVARELTKRHEELVAGTLPELAARYRGQEPKGEIVLLVGPPGEEMSSEQALDEALLTALKTMPPGKAAASVSAALRLPRGEVYARVMALKDGG